MIIPTSEFDPFFAPGETPFRDRMLAYIEREFGELPELPIFLENLTSPSPTSGSTASPESGTPESTQEEENRRVA